MAEGLQRMLRRGDDGVARRRIDVGGVRVHYLVAGRGRGGRGLPAVILAEPGHSAASMAPLLRAIGRTRLSFALDLPGHGRSADPPAGRRDPERWLLSWLERLRFEHCHLVVAGDSAGVAIEAVRRAPGKVTSVALLDPRTAGGSGDPAEATASSDLGGPGPLARALDLPAAVGHLGRAGARLRSAPARQLVAAMRPRNLEHDLRTIGVPVLVIASATGPTDPPAGAQRAATAAGATLSLLSGAGRGCYRTHPATIASLLDGSWGSIEGQEKVPST